MRIVAVCLVVLLGGWTLAAAAQVSAPRVRVETNLGSFVIELDTARAPITVENFLQYVRAGHYSGTIFHRVIANFIAQGGGYDEKRVEKPTRAGIPNESGNGLSNRRGTVALARTADPHSGTAQFYVNLADNTGLDPQPTRWGLHGLRPGRGRHASDRRHRRRCDRRHRRARERAAQADRDSEDGRVEVRVTAATP